MPTAWIAVMTLFQGEGMRASPATVAREYDLKAAFLLNFLKFVEWPPGRFPQAEGAWVIGVVGEDPFGENIDRIMQKKLINGHPLTVKRWKIGETPGVCQLLFVSQSENDRITELAKSTQKSSVLLVGETDHFLEQGGMINFYVESDKVKFAINPEAASRAGLTISSKLLGVAKIPRP